jgi:hypothetical protein
VPSRSASKEPPELVGCGDVGVEVKLARLLASPLNEKPVVDESLHCVSSAEVFEK